MYVQGNYHPQFIGQCGRLEWVRGGSLPARSQAGGTFRFIMDRCWLRCNWGQFAELDSPLLSFLPLCRCFHSNSDFLSRFMGNRKRRKTDDDRRRRRRTNGCWNCAFYNSPRPQRSSAPSRRLPSPDFREFGFIPKPERLNWIDIPFRVRSLSKYRAEQSLVGLRILTLESRRRGVF